MYVALYIEVVYTLCYECMTPFLILLSEEELLSSRTVTVTSPRTKLDTCCNTLAQRKVSNWRESALYLDVFSLKNMVTFLFLLYIFIWNHPNQKSNCNN